MIKRAKIDWTVRELCKYAEKGELTLDNVIQRGFIWDVSRKSLLIHTIMMNYPIPEFWLSKCNKVYDVLDGKQRYDAISGFIENKYALRNIPLIEDEEGQHFDVRNKKFSELPKEIQDNILNYKLEMHYFEDLTPEQTNEIFFRLNNGKPLTATEITKVKAKSLDKIMEITKHPVFEVMLTEKAKNSSTAIDIIMKAYVILFNQNKTLENKMTRQTMQDAEYTPEQTAIITGAFDIMLKVYEMLASEDNKEKMKENKKIMRRMMTKTHFVSLLPVSQFVNENEIEIEKYAQWISKFFNSTSGATISAEYNKNASTGSSYLAAVTSRLSIINDSFLEYISE